MSNFKVYKHFVLTNYINLIYPLIHVLIKNNNIFNKKFININSLGLIVDK